MIQLSSSSSKTQVGIFSPARVLEQETNKTVNTGTTIKARRCFRLGVAFWTGRKGKRWEREIIGTLAESEGQLRVGPQGTLSLPAPSPRSPAQTALPVMRKQSEHQVGTGEHRQFRSRAVPSYLAGPVIMGVCPWTWKPGRRSLSEPTTALSAKMFAGDSSAQSSGIVFEIIRLWGAIKELPDVI